MPRPRTLTQHKVGAGASGTSNYASRIPGMGTPDLPRASAEEFSRAPRIQGRGLPWTFPAEPGRLVDQPNDTGSGLGRMSKGKDIRGPGTAADPMAPEPKGWVPL